MANLTRFIAFFAVLLVLGGCPGPPNNNNGSGTTLRVTPAAISLAIGESQRISATSSDPEDTFQWSSSNTSIATVSSSGLVRAIAEGNCTVTVQGSNSEVSKSVPVAVPGAIAVNPTALVLRPTRTALLSARSTDTSDVISWASSDAAIATVAQTGIVTAVAEGEVTIEATGSRSNSTGTSLITVAGGAPGSVELTPAEVALQPGQMIALEATSADMEDTFLWSSSSTNAATVDGNGTVTAVADGETTILVIGTHSIGTASTRVLVSTTPPVEIEVTPAEVVLQPATTATLEATSTDAGDGFLWSSSDIEIATVDDGGTITAVAEGEATILIQGTNSDAAATATVTVAGPPAADITVTPGWLLLRPTGTTTLTATSSDIVDTFTWTSSDMAVATVSTDGTVTAIAEGEVTITAQGSNSASAGSASISVSGTPPAEIAITPAEIVLQPTQGATLVANSTDGNDDFVWSSSDNTIATVDTMGTVTAVAEGEVTIIARGTISNATGTAGVTVVAPQAATDITLSPGEVVLHPGFMATIDASSTDPLDTFTWTSSDDSAATVDGNGAVTAIAEGMTTITATGSNSANSGTALVTVEATPPAEIGVSPAEIILRPTQTAIFAATSTNDLDTFSWSSSDTSVSTVDSTGIVTAVGEGVVTIVARGSQTGSTGTASVTVAGAAPAVLSVSPFGLVLHPDSTATLTATSTDTEDGFNWSSSDDAIAAVDENGIVTAVSVGTVVITAAGTNSGDTASTPVTVEAAPVVTIDVTPAETLLRPGRTGTLEATSTNTEDTIVWTSSDNDVATVDTDGIVTAVAEGKTAILANGSVSGAVGSALVTVEAEIAVEIDVSPAGLALEAAETATLTATSTDVDDTFTWTSSNPAIATVSVSGVVTGVVEGETAISATGTNSGAAGSALVSISGVAPAGIEIVPESATLRIGEVTVLSATSTDPEDSFSWSSTNNAIATIDASGTVLGINEGQVTIEARGTNSGSTATATVSVSGVLPAGITVSPESITLRPTLSTLLVASSTNTQDAFTWTSSNTDIAAVTPGGSVVAITEGQAIITARGTQSGDTGTATVTVEGRAPADITIDPADTTIRPAQTLELSAMSTDPLDTFTWASSDNAVVLVDADGEVTGVAEGSAVITATGTASGDTGMSMLTVAGRPFADIVVTPVWSELRVGESALLGVTSTDDQDSFIWSSSDSNIVTVLPDGTVSAINIGVADITATGTSSGDSGEGQITVGSAEVLLQSSGSPLRAGSAEIFAAVSTDPDDTSYTWTSSNPDVAEVSNNGLVLALDEGTSTIRAVGDNSGSAGLVGITVIPAVTSLLLWDGEAGHTGANATINEPEAFRGSACLEATPTRFSSPTLSFVDYPGYRADISIYDEIWFFAKADLTGRTTDFRVRSFRGQSNTVNIDPYIDGGPLDLEYQLVRIPIADLQTDTFALDFVEDIFFGVALPTDGHKFFIDEIWAVSLDAVDSVSYALIGTLPSLSFGDVAVNTSAEQNVVLSNVGTDTLMVNNVSFEGINASEFSVTDTAFTVAPGATHEFAVTFTPDSVLEKATGDKNASLVIAHNLTPMDSTTKVALDGRAVSPAIATSTSSVSFGSVAVGQSSTRKIVVSNPGNATLTVSSASASDPAFVASPASFSIAPDASQELTITFTPLTTDTFAEVLTVDSDSTDSEMITVDLAGSGLPADTVGSLSVDQDDVTSSSVTMSWAEFDQAASVLIYMGPEPPATPDDELPLQVLLDTLAGDATTYTAEGLAPAVDTFFHIEILDAGDLVVAEGNAHARTVGGPLAELDNAVREVHLAGPNILQVIVTNDGVHSFTNRGNVNDGGLDRIVGDTGVELQAGPWTVTRNDGSPIGISTIYRQSIPSGTPYYESGVDLGIEGAIGRLNLNLIDLDHLLYLVLDEPVGTRDILTVVGPEITRETASRTHELGEEIFQPAFVLPYSDRYLETTTIQVNQVGYNPRATERYAYVSGWMGDGGPLSFNGFPTQADILIDGPDPLEERVDAVSNVGIVVRDAMDIDAGTEVREIDLVSVPAAEGVVYRVHLPGVGVSFPTQVSETAVFKAFYVSARGLFFNRWGRDLKPELTEWSPRPPDHPFVYTAETGDFLEERNAFMEDTPLIGQRILVGGHHDAADYDIRGQHFLVALYLMRIYELHPDAFLDGQLTIPESGNGIPDLLDEILWSLAAWEQLQEADGGVRGGVESYAHPSLINFADLDVLPYWTFTRSAYHSIRVSGLFAQAARLVEPFDPAKSAELLDRAIAAYDYAVANGVTFETNGPLMYAASELYRMTGDQDYRDVFETLWANNMSFGLGPSVFPFAPWAASYNLDSQPILLDYVFGYMLSDDPDPVFLEELFTRFDGYLEDTTDTIETHCAHRSARRETSNPNFGKGVAVGEYAMRAYSRLMLGDLTAQQEQDAINAISLSADYVLGCNALGRVWLTGLGSRPPTSHQHSESQTFRNAGFGFIPGISIYGPRSGLPGTATYDFGKPLLYPLFDDLPLMRRYADVGSWAGTAEFTIMETQAPHIALFGAQLSDGLLPPDSWLPLGEEHRNPLAPREGISLP
jgi:uncharacterized protein YjdB